MTPTEIIEIVDRMTPNAHNSEDKLRWLEDLDAMILTELDLLRRRFRMPAAESPTPDKLRLAVGAPFAEELYTNYLQACMAWADEEDARYDRFITRFNDAYERYMRFQIQTACAIANAFYRF